MKTINKIKSWMFLIIGLSMISTSCVKDDFDNPPFNIPVFELPAGAQIISIIDLKAGHTAAGQLDTVTTIDNLYIGGVVIGNDESGNIYKTLMIQDASGGIELKLNKTSLYNEFKVGQRIYVKLQNLVMGDYRGLIQLGGIYEGGVGQLPELAIKNHLFKDSLPGISPAPRKLNSFSEIVPEYISTLIRFDNVQFAEAGMPYVSPGEEASNRTLNIQGGTLVIRNSKYSNFANDIIPEGKGTVIGILSIYNGTYQLTLRQASDVFNFIPTPPPAEAIIDHVFINDPIATWGYQTVNVSGAQFWQYDPTNYYMKMGGFVGGVNIENEDWLITPALNLSASTAPYLEFLHAAKFGLPSTELSVWASTNYDGSNLATANWVQLSVPNYPSGTDWTFIESGAVNLTQFAGQNNVRIGFKYTSTNTSATTWEIKEVKVY
ncbi:MAG: DUF5689 domain-containing protein [Bacteroidales bacterium]|nr:DUF5689 domain-containing protein [Bacteroidales bacterium]